MLLQAVRTSLLNTILTPGNLTRNFYKFLSTSSKSNRFKVTVCGATGGIGQPLSLMLKQSNLVEELALYDVVSTHGVAMDISHVDTKCKIEAYSGPQEIGDALTDAKIVMITAGVPRKPGMSRDDLFDINAGIIKVLSESCLKYCPMALIGIVTNPVNSLVPVAYEVFRQGGLLNENRIFGVTALDSVRANTFVAELTRLKPEDVIVPVIGGHSSKTMVPLFSQTRPCVELSEIQIHKLTLAVQEAGTEVTKAKAGKGSATLATAFAAARFSVALAKALTGESNIIECAYVRSNVCKSPLCILCYFKMNDVIDNPADCEVRSVIRFLNARHLKPAEIYRQLKEVYGDTVMNERNVRKWCEMFNNGRTNVHDETRPGRPSLITEDLKTKVNDRILQDRRTSLDELHIAFLDISRSLLGEIVSQHLGYHKICARPHTAASTRELLDQFGWEIFDHPPYSPDFAPSDFHLFTKLKDFLGGTRFGSDEELKKTVNTWLNELAAEYNTGILKLVNRYDKCLNVGGDYVEK
ncbi:hypothetical protein ANN_19800 [Periplaneta americana]|uniref:Malate dehydrogenase, mitochondrial n=1 Tax=Periplaneta americana TaxID=6978 RepID=A0ABQ8SAW5_PERAM|nr:hypothetical protein ANN_19800 [Periplaneta americana]